MVRPGDRHGLGLRSRTALRRRRLRGHPHLRREDLQAGGAPRAAVRLGPRHLDDRADAARGDGGRDGGGGPALGDHRGLHPPHRHPRRGRPGPRSPQVPASVHHHHRGHDQAVAGGGVRDRPQGRHRRHADPAARVALAPGQVAQLPGAHPGQDRRRAGRRRRSAHARQRGQRRRGLGPESVHRQARRHLDAGGRTPASSRA